ncbi:metallophosphoesterase [Sutcliffiella cohnii]|uniref:Metallophosphoesterase n=1 Tax=Sutcliffiella cohnii TaxID=33932 RepID=A0A223KY27_9BACI|nr:metallophosphoesterase [Sutcliffiella cohnii]
MIGILICLMIVGIVLLVYMYRLAHENNVIFNSFSFVNYPSSFRPLQLFFISDIHKRVIDDKLIVQVKAPVDAVIIGGDLLEKGVPFSRVEENVKNLQKIGPVYFVWGNNDYEVDYHYLDSLLLSLNVKILDNTAINFESENGEIISILGVDDLSQERDRLNVALKEAEKNSFKLLIAHEPPIVSKFTTKENISLVLAGHTHGGQIRLFGYGPYELGKVHHLEHTTLLVSNGYGTTGVPLRLGAKSETHLITIKGTD